MTADRAADRAADSPASPMRLSGIERLYRQSGLFGWQLRGRGRDSLRPGLQDPWRGDPARGSDILAFRANLSGDSELFSGFGWLRDLRAEGSIEARSRVRDLISEWINGNQAWRLPDWRPDLMGQRLAILALNYGWYGDSADEAFQARLAHSVEMQLRCLAMDWRRMVSIDGQIGALRGLALAEAALGGDAGRIEALQDMLASKLGSAIHPDGGHVSRMPDRHITLMRQLVEFRMATSLAGIDGAVVSDCMARMGGVARMWRHGDGRLAHFNGGGGVSAETTEETMLRAGVRGKAVQQAPYTGFLRMGSGRTVVIMDAGDPAPDVSGDTTRSFGTLGFEMSVGPTQLVVNSGQMMTDPTLRRVMCSTAAHSTLGLDNQNSSSPREERLASISAVEVGEAPGGILAVASHDGFERSHGILHHRKLYLKTGGTNLRGSDHLEYTGAPGEIPNLAVIRFHLHPKVTAASLANGSVLMKIRGSRTGWTFKAEGAVIEIDNSVYFEDGVRQAGQQIVLKSVISDIRTTGAHEIRWAFLRGTE
ncbi:MAG: heparinase II/III family protein [Candidatus Puniceispirillaceae bacterium]